MMTNVLLWAVAVLVLAGFVQGLTGFGFGMITMALLPLVMGFDQAQAVVTLAGLTTTLMMTGLTLKHLHWPSTVACGWEPSSASLSVSACYPPCRTGWCYERWAWRFVPWLSLTWQPAGKRRFTGRAGQVGLPAWPAEH